MSVPRKPRGGWAGPRWRCSYPGCSSAVDVTVGRGRCLQHRGLPTPPSKHRGSKPPRRKHRD